MSVVLQNNTANRISVGRFVLKPRESKTISKTDFLHHDPFVPNSLAADVKRMSDLNFITVVYNGLSLGADAALTMGSSDTDIEVFSMNIAGLAAADDASVMVVADGAYEILAIRAGVNLAITANDTNFITVTVTNQTTAATVAEITTETTGTGNLVLWQNQAMAVVAAEKDVTGGDVISVGVVATVAGVAYDLTVELVMVRSA